MGQKFANGTKISNVQGGSMKKPSEKFCAFCGSSQEKMYSVKSLSALIDCSEQTLRAWIQDRTIGYVKIGGLVRIPQAELEKLMERRPSIDESVNEALSR